MNQQKIGCNHTKAEEQYICLEASCLINKEYKLDCHRCLMQNHPHSNSITRIGDLIIEAQKQQQLLTEHIENNIKFCLSQKEIVESEVQEKRNKMNEWLDQLKKHQMQEIEEYENELKLQKQKIATRELTQDNLEDLIDFRHLNIQRYEQQNEVIKKAMDYNKTQFNEYFTNQYERISKNYLLNKITLQELPKLEQTYQVYRIINYEKCTSEGCSANDKIKLCLEKNCLLKNDLTLECPQCLTNRHWAEQKQTHKNQFVSANELWDLQNKYIDEVNNFCDVKESEISKVSQELQQLIIEFQKFNEQKLQQFMLFIIEKEKQILLHLSKQFYDLQFRFKSQYQKEKFVIYKDLLLQTDYSVLADIIDQEFNFKNISAQFKKQYQNELNYSQQQYQDLWLMGSCLVQSDNIFQKSEKVQNPISLKIQDLQNQISNLEYQKDQNDAQIQDLNSQLDRQLQVFEKNFLFLIKDNQRLEQIYKCIKQVQFKLRGKTQSQRDVESQELLNSLKQIHELFPYGTQSKCFYAIQPIITKLEKILDYYKDSVLTILEFESENNLNI